MSRWTDTLLRMNSRRSTRNVALTGAFLAIAAGSLTACDDGVVAEGGEKRVYYCVDESNTVVAEDRCDEDGDGHGGAYYLFHTSPGSSYTTGQQIPASSGSRFPHHDQAARKAAGIPETGKVSNGSVKTGVVGKGGGAPAKGGSAGG
jgi:hypothetical protein